MRKLLTLALFVIVLTGCVSVNFPADDSKPQEPKPQQETPVNPSSNDVNVNKPQTDAISAQDAYILDTFAEYGYTVPDRSQWIVEQQGPQKVAVIIKENIGQGKPNISKLVFLWDNQMETGELLHVMVSNTVKFGTDQ